ncbi:heat shock 70 kDa protein 12A-like [Dreissena polymorpha]|uniref:heat shock 70 kDa protein 12A-like n=1 Tax=Dreissena polymorpha TaxID=45954 RepID=UPI002263E50D|nr:heat shock 70 kDa protein 12A-like [Dreissena polymorpha]
MAQVAFDFGIKHTKYAYSLTSIRRNMFESRFKDVLDDGRNFVSTKTFSSILIDDKGQFHSFGLKAEYHFASLERENELNGFKLFRRFPNTLQIMKHISRKSTIKDVSGKDHEALPIFVMAIQALKKYLMDDIQDRTTNSREHDIRYVITLPAIWDVGANQFMREAAIQVELSISLSTNK